MMWTIGSVLFDMGNRWCFVRYGPYAVFCAIWAIVGVLFDMGNSQCFV